MWSGCGGPTAAACTLAASEPGQQQAPHIHRQTQRERGRPRGSDGECAMKEEGANSADSQPAGRPKLIMRRKSREGSTGERVGGQRTHRPTADQTSHSAEPAGTTRQCPLDDRATNSLDCVHNAYTQPEPANTLDCIPRNARRSHDTTTSVL